MNMDDMEIIQQRQLKLRLVLLKGLSKLYSWHLECVLALLCCRPWFPQVATLLQLQIVIGKPKYSLRIFYPEWEYMYNFTVVLHEVFYMWNGNMNHLYPKNCTREQHCEYHLLKT